MAMKLTDSVGSICEYVFLIVLTIAIAYGCTHGGCNAH